MALGRKPIEIVNEGKHQLLTKAEHWGRIYLNEVAKVQNGFAFSSSNFAKTDGLPLIRIRDIDKKSTVDRYNGEYSEEFIVRKGDILVGMDGDFKAALWKGENALLNQRVCRIIPNSKKYDSKFLFICLQPYLNAINAETSSVTVKHLSSKTIEEIPLPFPTFSEQLGIVSKIEELLSDLENGKQQLQTALQQLKIYRQSLLKWAFEGRFGYAQRPSNDMKDGELPKGWKWVTFGNVCKKIGDIDHKMPKQLATGYPYISTKDFTDNLKISFDNAKYISEEDYLNLSRKIKPENGDIIFPRYGTIGKNILIDFDKDFLVSYSCAVIKPDHNLVLSKYAYLYSLSPKITKEIRKYTVETTQANIGIGSIKNFIFPLASIEEQQHIVNELESKLSVCDKIEETINQSLQHAETLRQSILKKAFEGKLI